MSESNERRDRLASMAADALVEDVDTVEADLLLRYDRAPEALADTERERVERYLAASPANRQQLRSLVRFAEARGELFGGEGGGGAGGEASGAGEAEATAISITSHPRWRARAAVIAAALAASVLAALLYGTKGDLITGERPGSELVAEGPVANDSAPGLVPEIPELRDALPEARSEAPETQLALGEADEDETPALAPVAPEPEPLLAEVHPPTLPTPRPTPEPAPAPTRPPSRATEPAATQPDGPESVPDQGLTREPILLAMHVVGPLRYARPGDAVDFAALQGLRNVDGGLPTLQALVPDHVARTLSESPSLYWYLSEETDRPLEIVLSDRVSIDPLLQLSLESPISAGMHAVDLAAHDIVLEAGKEYRWFVSLFSDESAGSQDLVTRGAIVRVAPDPALAERLELASPGERGQIYAEQGFWYDALDFISGSIERAPEEARLREIRADLLEQSGLSEAAAYNRDMARAQTSPGS